MMKIEVWSDFVCPFCYIGKRRLEEALEQFPHKEDVEVIFKSFELDPNSERNSGKTIHEALASKYGTSIEQAKKMNENMGQQAAAVGLDFQFDNMIPTNTFDAHRLAKYAKNAGKAPEMTERLLKAYFTQSQHIGSHETLLKLAEEVGLDRNESEAVLRSSDFENEVRADEEEARNIGVQGVPFFVLNRKYAISGAQPLEVFTNALQKVWEEENAQPSLQTLTSEGSDGMTCSDDGCEIPNEKN
jgi:predicted DsbA family dithiol-disulfide isomerase